MIRLHLASGDKSATYRGILGPTWLQGILFSIRRYGRDVLDGEEVTYCSNSHVQKQ